VFQTKVEEEN